MNRPLVVLLYSPRFIPADVLDFVARLAPADFRWQAVAQDASDTVRLAAFAAADYMLAYPGDPTVEELAQARRLKLFQLLSAGFDWLDLESFKRYGIMVASNDGSNAVSTAEHTLLLMLALLKQLPRHHAAMVDGHWWGMTKVMQMRELRGQVVGLVGIGRIAQQVACRLNAFGATTLYTKPNRADEDTERRCNAAYRTLDALLAESNIVSLHAPLLPATRGLLDARALGLMKRGSCLINTARGALVDETALVDALGRGHLAGAGLDAFAHEPIDPASPLLRMDNIVLTPHIAGATRDAWLQRMSMAWENVRRVAAGGAPASRIA